MNVYEARRQSVENPNYEGVCVDGLQACKGII